MAFLTQEQLQTLGFKSLGKNVLLSDKAAVYGAQNISIGDNCRIDDFCIISAGAGGIILGRHVHIACYVSLIGHASIIIDDFAGLSGRTSVYSSSDDFSGDFLTGPTVSADFTNVKHAAVHIGKHVVIGAGTVILPGVEIGEGSAIGSMSLVSKSCKAFGVYTGVPARFAKRRNDKIMELELAFLASSK
ncbi:galactoside O-acetyltransferase [Hymenobacter daecheongensis DSM 21074]|uniref:Chloramphenicol acetyltransferase n=1 Tax=Hymenobacter daecheongensis DSM 21074 TaxID=1121955 RepID=A0A1M6CI76_9BACT|nr:acyltransferase [Hymenobacter daecheongensis]SHI60699.1 galactoside O-acetyltransferase [Hymenobacter daecheongensis DSM 21074]